ncbi:MAG: OmpA family protein [Elusimicrobiota bacterium]
MRRNATLSLVAAAALFAACATSKTGLKSDADKDKIAKSSSTVEAAPAAPPADVTEASLRNGGFTPRADLKNVPFDYDSAKLSEEATIILKANSDALKSDESIVVLVAGHCDERGTTAYNLALGQKRAKQVRDYYVSLGIDGGRMATISYGKEQPLCKDSDDACWSKNRRAETLAKTAAPAPAQ